MLLSHMSHPYIRELFSCISSDDTILPDELGQCRGIYNSFLFSVFPSADFTVWPQYPLHTPQGHNRGILYSFIVEFVREREQIPVFFLDVKPAGDIEDDSARAVADKKMRQTFRILAKSCKTPKLYGFSAMGQKLALYCLDMESRHITPAAIECSSTRITDTVPQEWWDIDITTQAGYDKFMEVAQETKGMVGLKQTFDLEGKPRIFED
ncbi:hypothetical protein BDZ97DRAFT_1832379 [Flammula alnicola]|nr:hypothetical protein BDZ97DRAFT_1832379 [Flammula alnicola]